MTPWHRLESELAAQNKLLRWLAGELDLKEQAVNHWPKRGVPSKHHAAIERILKKPRGWLTGDVDAFAPPSYLSSAAVEIAVLFDMIPVGDRVRRAQAFNAASTAIMQVLQSSGATPQP
jgi:hypothetical protein